MGFGVAEEEWEPEALFMYKAAHSRSRIQLSMEMSQREETAEEKASPTQTAGVAVEASVVREARLPERKMV
jgi:hypothetical protein